MSNDPSSTCEAATVCPSSACESAVNTALGIHWLANTHSSLTAHFKAVYAATNCLPVGAALPHQLHRVALCVGLSVWSPPTHNPLHMVLACSIRERSCCKQHLPHGALGETPAVLQKAGELLLQESAAAPMLLCSSETRAHEAAFDVSFHEWCRIILACQFCWIRRSFVCFAPDPPGPELVLCAARATGRIHNTKTTYKLYPNVHNGRRRPVLSQLHITQCLSHLGV